MRKNQLIVVAFLLTLFIIPTIFTSSYGHKIISAEPNIVKDFQPAAAGWYDTFWSYRKSVSINGASGAGTDYPINFTISYDSDMQTDFDDIRFTDDDGTTELDYWIESYVDSTNCTVWVEVADDLGSNVEIYMYYGNTTVSTTSSGTDTFTWFDSFEYADALTNHGWTAVGGTADTSLTQQKHGERSMRMTGAVAVYYEQQSLTTAYHGFFWLYDDGITGNGQRNLAGFYDTDLNDRIVVGYYPDENEIHYVWWDGTWHESGILRTAGWHKIEMWCYGGEVYGNFDDISLFTSSDRFGHIEGCRTERTSNIVDTFLDTYMTMKYVNPAPSFDDLGERESKPEWRQINDPVMIIFSVVFDMWGMNTALIILGLVMIPVSTIYLAYGIKHDRSSNRLFYGLILFMFGCGLFIGGILP